MMASDPCTLLAAQVESSFHLPMKKSYCAFFLTALAGIVEPPSGKVYFATWIDTQDSFVNATDGDRPLAFNRRLGYNASVFQYAQNIPIDTFSFPVEQIEVLDTNAVILLTVYPRPSPWTISDNELKNLTAQCAKLNSQKRKLLIRFGAEMNGDWNFWGMQPRRFIELWRRVYTAFKKDAPLTDLVWAPSSGNGCIFSLIRSLFYQEYPTS